MRRQLPLLLLLVYVTLDFGNPLMPGAVRFEGGSFEPVQATRAARTGAAIMTAPALLPSARAPLGEGVRVLRAPVSPAAPARPLRVVRRPALEPCAPSPPPTEDH